MFGVLICLFLGFWMGSCLADALIDYKYHDVTDLLIHAGVCFLLIIVVIVIMKIF